jgi:hypothetical protein
MPFSNKEKQAVWFHNWYLQHRKERIALAKQQRVNDREWFRALKRTLVCLHCGEDDARCLDFHHRDPSTKLGVVSNMCVRGRKAVLAEIEKCDVLCANCHRKIHVAV